MAGPLTSPPKTVGGDREIYDGFSFPVRREEGEK